MVELEEVGKAQMSLMAFSLFKFSVQTTRFALWMTIIQRCTEYFPLYMLKSNEDLNALPKNVILF